MKELIERLEKATEGSRALDAAIWENVDSKAARIAFHNGRAFTNRDWSDQEKDRKARDKMMRLSPHYTTSLDAALTLVPEGWTWGKRHGHDGDFMECYPSDWLQQTGFKGALGDRRTYSATESTKGDALALCIAALKARADKEG